MVFKEKEDIDVKVKLVSWNRAYESIVSSFKNGHSPDVFQYGTTWVNTFAYLDYLYSIKDYNQARKPIVKWINEACHYQGDRIAVPWSIDSVVMVGRQDILDELGISSKDIRTREGFYKACMKIVKCRKKDKSIPKPLAFSIRPDMDTLHRFISWFFASGYSFSELNSNTENIFARQEFLNIFQYLHKLIKGSDIHIENIDKHPYQLNEDFYHEGAYVFYLGNWYGIIFDFLGQNYKPDKEDYKITPLLIPSINSNTGTHGGGSVLSISSKTEYPIKSKKLLEFLSTEDFWDGWIYNTGNIPAHDNAFWENRFEDKEIETLYKLTANSITYPFHPTWTGLENIMAEGISRCMWKLFDKSIVDIEKEINPILKEIDQTIIETLKMSWEMN